jgi:hypothetical protein
MIPLLILLLLLFYYYYYYNCNTDIDPWIYMMLKIPESSSSFMYPACQVWGSTELPQMNI